LSHSHSLYKRDVAVIKRYGDKYKLIWMAAKRQKGIECRDEQLAADEHSATKGEVKLENNISRAKSRIFELAMCNEWHYFVTMTLDKGKYNRYDLSRFQADLSQFVRDQRKKWGCELRYLFVPEQHKLRDGELTPAWHIHGLLQGVSLDMVADFPVGVPGRLKGYLNYPDYMNRFGWCSLAPISNPHAVSAYITKYVSKHMGQGVAVGNRLFYASVGLNGAETIKEGILACIPPKWDFENDYVKIAWLDENEIDNYII
jgi:hypothetical protein